MKCPKCSYNSFELYDSCKKCGSDLAGFKQSFAIRPIVHPPQFLAAETIPLAAFAAADTMVDEEMPQTAAAAEAISWDLPAGEPAAEDDGFAGFDLDFSMEDEKEEPPALAAASSSSKEELGGFGEFSFDEEPAAAGGASELDDLLAQNEPDVPPQESADEFDFEEEFAFETNSLSLGEEGEASGDFDLDNLLTDEPSTEEPAKASGPSIDLSDSDDWPSFFEEEDKEGSKK